MWNNWEKMKEKLYNVSMIFMGLLASVCLLGMANGAKEVDIVSGTIMVILTIAWISTMATTFIVDKLIAMEKEERLE